MRAKKKPSKKDIVKRILIAVGIFISVVLLFCLPDIIWAVRGLIAMVPILNKILILSGGSFSYDQYIPMMLTIFNCIITASLAFGAYNLSKILGKIQLEDHDGKCMLWALKISAYLKKNMNVIYKQSSGTGNLSELLSIDAEEYMIIIISLQSSNVISQEEREMLIDCVKNFQQIQEKLQLGDTKAVDEIVSGIISRHIQLDPIFSLKKPLIQIIDKLDAASKEENSYD